MSSNRNPAGTRQAYKYAPHSKMITRPNNYSFSVNQALDWDFRWGFYNNWLSAEVSRPSCNPPVSKGPDYLLVRWTVRCCAIQPSHNWIGSRAKVEKKAAVLHSSVTRNWFHKTFFFFFFFFHPQPPYPDPFLSLLLPLPVLQILASPRKFRQILIDSIQPN